MVRVTSASAEAGMPCVSRGCYAIRTPVPTRGSRFSEHCAAPPERDFSRIQRFGVEEASNMLDHSSVKMTEVYAERDREQALEIAKQVG